MLKDNFTNKEIRELESLQADIDAEEELDEFELRLRRLGKL